VFEWIILAALAAVVLYQLYATLGSPGWAPARGRARRGSGQRAARDLKPLEAPPEALSGIAALRARQTDFDIGHFLAARARPMR
jgi:hypothetical protein